MNTFYRYKKEWIQKEKQKQNSFLWIQKSNNTKRKIKEGILFIDTNKYVY